MADLVIDDKAAQEWLRGHIERAGGLTDFCWKHDVTLPHVSQMANGKKPITGKVARVIGLKRVNYYELTKVVASPEQERYENSRREWLEQNPIITAEELEQRRAALEEQAWAEVLRTFGGLLRSPAK